MGLSDYAVGRQCGIAPSTFTDWKRGKYTPKADKLTRLAEFFDVPLQYFFGEYIVESPTPVIEDASAHYYIDEETREAAEELRTNKELRLLFDAGRDASPDDLRTVHQMLLALKRKEQGNE